MKSFDKPWTKEEINEYMTENQVLILFVPDMVNKSVTIAIYGKMYADRRQDLLYRVMEYFGGSPLTPSVCNKINRFALKWYSKNILKKKSRVINVKRGKQWK